MTGKQNRFYTKAWVLNRNRLVKWLKGLFPLSTTSPYIPEAVSAREFTLIFYGIEPCPQKNSYFYGNGNFSVFLRDGDIYNIHEQLLRATSAEMLKTIPSVPQGMHTPAFLLDDLLLWVHQAKLKPAFEYFKRYENKLKLLKIFPGRAKFKKERTAKEPINQEAKRRIQERAQEIWLSNPDAGLTYREILKDPGMITILDETSDRRSNGLPWSHRVLCEWLAEKDPRSSEQKTGGRPPKKAS